MRDEKGPVEIQPGLFLIDAALPLAAELAS